MAVFAMLVGAAALTPAQARSQEPQEPRDTLPAADTLTPPRLGLPAQDTLARDTVEEPPPPPPENLPEIRQIGPAGFARGVWEWDRDALERLPDLALLDLLERIPGVVPIRSDVANHAETAVVFGAGTGAIRYVIDGFELDPLTGPTFDAARLPLLAMENVRIERRVTGATVYIDMLTPDEPEPGSIIEAATGDFDVQAFRGMFFGPRVMGGPVAAGFERLASDGSGSGATNHTAGWLKWSWVRDSVGLQVEYRQSGMDRAELDTNLSALRRDWLVRGRAARGPFTGEVYAGASHAEEEYSPVDAAVEGAPELVIREGSPHGGARLRARFAAPVPVDGLAAVRFRDHPRLPESEIELGVHASPLPFLGLEVEAVQGWWDHGTTGRWAARGRVGPFLGASLFGEVFRGEPLAGTGHALRIGSPDSAALRISRDGLRLGAEARLGGFHLAGAALRTTADSVHALGFLTEFTAPTVPGGTAEGFEVTTRIPTGWDPLSLEGWYVGMDAPADWLYLPRHHWRAGIEYHHLPLPSGNLEIFARIQHVFRGRMTVPWAPELADPNEPADPANPTDTTPPEGPPITQVASYRATNLELSIRVIRWRAFLRWENIFNRAGQQDLPLFTHPGQHVVWGAKLEFGN